MSSRFTILALVIIAAALAFFTFSLSEETEKPLVFALQKQKDPALIARGSGAIMKALSHALGREVRVMVPGEYSATVQALISGHADVGYMSSLPYMLAKRDGGAKLLLVEERKDTEGQWQTRYDAVLVARADSALHQFDDIKSAAASLRMVFTSHTSASGYVFPFAYFREQGLLSDAQKPEDVFAEVRYAGGYAQALQQLLSGKADIAAVSSYVVEGEQSHIYITPKDREKLKVIARISGVPTHIIATRAGLNERERNDIATALLGISERNPELLTQIYGAARLVAAPEDAHIAATRKAIATTRLPIHGVVQ